MTVRARMRSLLEETTVLLDFPHFRQAFDFDCGAVALQSVLAYYGIDAREELIANKAGTNEKRGTPIPGLLKVLTKVGLKHEARTMTVEEVRSFIGQRVPVILALQAWADGKANYATDMKDGHYAVAIGYEGDSRVIFSDPSSIHYTFLTPEELEERWHDRDSEQDWDHFGIAVFGTPAYANDRTDHMESVVARMLALLETFDWKKVKTAEGLTPEQVEMWAQEAAKVPRSKVKTITAKFDSVCPSCKRPVKTGSKVAATWDNVWRCPDCTEVFAFMGPMGGRFLSAADLTADRRRREIVRGNFPITALWNK